MPTMREAWSKGIIDEKTLVWGTGLIDWLPIRNVTLLTAAIRTPEVQLATWLKKKLVFERRLSEVRKERAGVRKLESNQMDQWS